MICNILFLLIVFFIDLHIQKITGQQDEIAENVSRCAKPFFRQIQFFN